ncbi:MurR/RpiR family transcriptional regulator [Anaerobium acetethylicum]|uniref:DNA-binding transcriptional regulator, MurR/RpiR family, contains HTH and SIS domains n=1 Tax=Anaerobium acetethylicum TaxID=1619234 RepID=A0A1D3TWL7_9FIRM|nr:MurR/RpiR family transcriptional regulator [Anaerobium acetethylicum]SCP98622.1 DNA-binding transcriptional regulator, MurR/RpiR family, contains HTH and SIS domains [Anaerobium acetethylicum]
MNDLFVRIRFLLPSLPRAEKAIAEALLENPEAITHLTLAEIARESGSSEASIIRFCKRMGYSGYSSLKEEFIRTIANGTEVESEGIELSDSMTTILKKVYQSNVQTLNDTLVLADEGYEKARNALIKARSIHFFGVGDAFAACQLAFMKFSRLGINCTAHSDTMLQLVVAGNMTEDDVAIAVSYEGRSKNIVECMKIAKQNGATTIAITKMNKSPLLRVTDISLFIAVNDLTVGRDKVTRRVADQFILDALYLGYATKIGNNHMKQLKKIQDAIDQNKI